MGNNPTVKSVSKMIMGSGEDSSGYKNEKEN
jgi:hypothetical protein